MTFLTFVSFAFVSCRISHATQLLYRALLLARFRSLQHRALYKLLHALRHYQILLFQLTLPFIGL